MKSVMNTLLCESVMNTLLCEYIIDRVIMFIPCRTRTARSSEFGDFELILLIRVDLVVVRDGFFRVDFDRLI